MKFINKLALCALVMAMPMAGCDTDELHNLNVNPQAVNQIDLNYLFSAAELGMASGGSAGDNRYIDWRTNIGFASYAIQQLSQVTGGIAPGNRYSEDFESAAAPFEFGYGDYLKNIAEVLRQTGPGGFAEGKHVNMRNAARIIRAFSFHRLTDFYGAIPYFEANKGMAGIGGETGSVFFPKYDKQSVIYPDLLKELDEATATMSASNPDEGFAKADFVYGGDITKWKKFGYSLMLRLAMRVSNVAPQMAAEYVTKAAAGGVFTSNADNFVVRMSAEPSLWVNQNGISRAFYPGDGGQPAYLSKTLVDFLKGADPATTADDDPRLMIISGGIGPWLASGFTPTATGKDPLAQKGMPNGLDAGMLEALEGGPVNQANTYSRINTLMLDRGEPYMIMNHAEVELLLAEALERKIGSGITGTAQEHYNTGVKSAMQMYTLYDASLTVSDAQVASYLATYPYGSKGTLPMIYEQLWVSKFLNWWEAWSDWRRTGYPQLTPANYPGNITGGTIPVRLKYPTNEAAGNPNFNAGATLPDLYTTPVWWDGGQE